MRKRLYVARDFGLHSNKTRLSVATHASAICPPRKKNCPASHSHLHVTLDSLRRSVLSVYLVRNDFARPMTSDCIRNEQTE